MVQVATTSMGVLQSNGEEQLHKTKGNPVPTTDTLRLPLIGLI